jgi:hypothetical protein
MPGLPTYKVNIPSAAALGESRRIIRHPTKVQFTVRMRGTKVADQSTAHAGITASCCARNAKVREVTP